MVGRICSEERVSRSVFCFYLLLQLLHLADCLSVLSRLTMRVQRNFTMAESLTRSSSPDSLFVAPPDDHYHAEHAPQRRRLSPQPSRLALPPVRQPGDGYDYRRPVMSSAITSQNTQEHDHNSLVIDLTDEAGTEPAAAPYLQPLGDSQGTSSAAATTSRATRGPRFGRNIIDVGSEGEEEGHSTSSSARTLPRNNYEYLFPRLNQRPQPHPQFSVLRRPQRRTTPGFNMDDIDDVQFLDSRPASQARNRPISRAPRSVTPYPNGHNEPIDLTGDDDDEVLHVDTRVRPALNLDRPAAVAGTRFRSIADRMPAVIADVIGTGRLFDRLNNYMGRDMDDGNTRHNNHGHANAGPGPHIHFGGARIGLQVELNLGGMMDYATPAFDMGFQGANRPPEPKYEPPKDVEKGFTRNPGEEEVVVCPNCGDELAVGDTDLKQQVWVIKKCGHVS